MPWVGSKRFKLSKSNHQNAIDVRLAFGGFGTHPPGTASQSVLLSLHLQREICRNGCGKTTSMIPLIIFVFGEFGSPVQDIDCDLGCLIHAAASQ